MNRLYLTFIITLILISPKSILAQKDVTQFLGIPVDGYKPEMKKKLKEKGFWSSEVDNDVLEGEFNGKKVKLFIVTNNNKVYRIMVADAIKTNETDIKIRFNRLCQQFFDNVKYMGSDPKRIKKFLIPEDEDISYEMSVNNKRYQAFFYQKTNEFDSLINTLAQERINKDPTEFKIDENSTIFNKQI